ncbi:FHA domain-containing protein [Planktothrix sp. FACHB-1365]|uniref:FHA domain-containing protein n=1 Tax=Planktothrix sp. FACHB-1365 TaxID=2692855 RepID=UPI0016850242|nr:FHA domain-containing protein [Planktothrix sp. FACHB-1365]MBD2481440.1 FHA domain-containing protein [Planktothrix sp. FACHB-1365]
MQIRLSWQNLETGEWRTPVLTPPIALGRVFERMPSTVNGERVSRLVLNGERVSRFHGLITWENGTLMLTDTGSRNGILVNGIPQTRCLLQDGDLLQIAHYNITLSLVTNSFNNLPQNPSQISFSLPTKLPDTDLSAPTVSSANRESFPPPSFVNSLQISVQQLQTLGLQIDEIDYLTIGAGLGSFIWVDLLRISGVKSNQIMALGIDNKPYTHYQQLCLNSQIPPQERLRSNSDSCPDNIWGWPSYALREAYTEAGQGQFLTALKLLWQVFAEPTFAETYTPRSGNVFNSIDREANRIQWSQMYRYGRVKSIRKLTDGRYAIAYSRSTENRRDHGFILARYVQIATGYPAIQFLPDLQAYREQTKDFKTVVNAYENHDYIYQQLEQSGGTVIIRGRGIVASRILQRLYEARQKNSQIQILHLMRSPKAQGNQFEKAKRTVENHFEFQPFNWPKASWGGDLRQQLEAANPQDRLKLLEQWGGTTTARRKDWRNIVNQGLRQGWYRITFGTVERVEPTPNGRTLTTIREQGLNANLQLEADFIIDATGLDAKVNTNPLLNDLVTHYNLPLNALGRLSVTNDFELVEMRNSKDSEDRLGGRIYAAGAITLGGPYAAVDSFLGLQYAALVSVENLASLSTPGLRKLTGWRSLWQWFKWVNNQPPN